MPLVPVLQLLPSAAAEAGRLGFAVKAQSVRDSCVCVFLTAPYTPWHHTVPSQYLHWDTLLVTIFVSQLAWHGYISEKEIWRL